MWQTRSNAAASAQDVVAFVEHTRDGLINLGRWLWA
jgi:hypothetical protein